MIHLKLEEIFYSKYLILRLIIRKTLTVFRNPEHPFKVTKIQRHLQN